MPYLAQPATGIVTMVIGQTPGPASGIKYHVEVGFDGQPVLFENVTPGHRRPAENVNIVAARPGDVATVHWFGDEVAFQIHEGIDDTEICDTP